MASMREVTFVTGTVVTPQYLNDQQDVESPAAWGVRVVQASNTVVSVPVAVDGSPTGSTTIIIDGYPRLITAPIVLSISGVGRTLDIYATILGQLITDGFTIQGVAHGAAAPASSRKIAEVDWNGNAITAIRNLIDAVSGHNGAHAIGGSDPITPASIGALTTAALGETVAHSSDYTALAGDTVLMSGGNNVNLPNAPPGQSPRVRVVSLAANPAISTPPNVFGPNTIINCAGTDTIQLESVTGLTTLTLNPGCSCELTYLGGVWYVTNLQLRNLGYFNLPGPVTTSNTPVPVAVGASQAFFTETINIVNPNGAEVDIFANLVIYTSTSTANVQVIPYFQVDGAAISNSNTWGILEIDVPVTNANIQFSVSACSVDPTSGSTLTRMTQGVHTITFGIEVLDGATVYYDSSCWSSFVARELP